MKRRCKRGGRAEIEKGGWGASLARSGPNVGATQEQMWGLRTDTFRCRRAGKMDALPLTIPSGNVRIKGKLERTGKLEKYHAFSFDLKIAATKRRDSH